MFTSFYNGKEKKNKNKLSLKKSAVSPQMKLGDKPNKIGTKKWKYVFFCFHSLCSRSVCWEDLCDLFSWVFPEQKKLQCNFHQPISKMLTEGDDYCFQVLVGEAGRDTIV